MATITLGESLCGTKIVFLDHPGYSDGIVVEIPTGIQNKEVLLFNGLGMPIDEGRFGELHLTINIRAGKSELEVLRNNSPYFQGLFTIPEVSVENKKVFSANRIH
jgi:DnaJ-class molecular chaperone